MSVLSCRNSYPWACCCSVRLGWGWLLTEVAEGEGLGGVQMVWLCKSIFLLNKRIRFCSGSNLFSCIHLLHVCARTMAGFPPALPCPSHWAALSGENGSDLRVRLCPPMVCPRQPFGASLLHQSVQFTAGGGISSALVCCIWPEAHGIFVSLEFCGTAGGTKVIQVTSGTASDGLLQLSRRYCLYTAASAQMGIEQRLGCKRRWQKYPGHCRSVANFKLLVNVFL